MNQYEQLVEKNHGYKVSFTIKYKHIHERSLRAMSTDFNIICS